ncbi:MAG: DUF4339 domain-containing protein [Akkermansia sp.]|nr:DUF4339 domain-containing protein [Akkermansia sp.]
MDIYWIKDKKQHGPATVPDVISLVQMGELTPDTLGWHAGCNGWKPLRELPALVDFLGELHNKSKGAEPELPPIPQSPEKPQQPEEETEQPGPQPQIELTMHASQAANEDTPISLPLPRTRLIARLIDSALYSALAAPVLYLLQIPFTDLLLPLFWAPMVLIEAALLTWRGTTPGKWFMGIAVSSFSPGGAPLTFGRAFFRSLSVNVMGMGCYLFPIGVITILIGYFTLTKRGITMWDAQCFTLPLQRRSTGFRHIFLASLIIYFALQITGNALIRTPGAIDLIERTTPEMARSLREMMPDLPSTAPKEGTAAPATPQPLQ